MQERQRFIEPADAVMSLRRQCKLLSVSRSHLYYPQRAISESDLILMHLIDEQYTKTPFYGSRKMVVYLAGLGHIVNRKRIQRLMRMMGIFGICPGPSTSKRHPQHVVYPYLLRNVKIVKSNQVWSADITYIRMLQGFAYLVAIMDWYSRYVLAWQLSNTLDVSFCTEALLAALRHGKPEIFNTDQGSQFTSHEFTSPLLSREIRISMDGRGRAFDNIFNERLWRSVKYENIYLQDYHSIVELRAGLADYFHFYNELRFHQALDYKTPAAIYNNSKSRGL